MVGLQGLFASCLLAPLVLASPHLLGSELSSRPKVGVVRDVSSAGIRRDLLLSSREPGAPMVRRNGLAARTDTRSFSFDQSLEDQLIFDSSDIPGFPGPSIQVACVKCCSTGSVEATFPSDLEDIINPKFRVDLTGMEVFVEVDVVVSAGNTFYIPLLALPPGLTNIELPGFRAGLFIDLRLVFELSAQADIRSGFYLKIPDGSFFEIDISDEGFTTQDFTGVISKPLPVTINNDETGLDFKVDLQLRAELGISASTNPDLSLPGIGDVDIDIPFIDLPNIGAGAMVGAFVNVVEYIATVTPEENCTLEANQELNLNMGVFAKVGVNVGDEFLGIEPSATTTLFTLPLPSVCLLDLGETLPIREAPLPTAAECGVALPIDVESAATGMPPQQTVVSSVVPTAHADDQETAHITEASTLAHTAALPYPTNHNVGHMLARRQEGSVEEFTAVACVSDIAGCPEDLRTTLTYKSTVCPPAPVETGGCFAVTDASMLEPTSVVWTKEVPAQTETAKASHGPGYAGVHLGKEGASSCRRSLRKRPGRARGEELRS